MRLLRMSAAATLLALLVGTPVASAQVPERGVFQVYPKALFAFYDNASSLTDGWGVGVDALYHVASGFQLGLTVDVLQTETEKDFFPRARLNFENFVELWDVTTPATFVNYGLLAAWTLPNVNIAPTIEAGVAGYTAFMNAEQFRTQTRSSGWGFVIGGGLTFPLGERTGIHIHVRDYLYQQWDRDEFNPVAPQFQDTSFPEFAPDVDEKKDTANRLQFGIGFRFIP